MAIVLSNFSLVFNTQYITIKKVIPRCLQRKDSVKNKEIINTEKAM